MSIQAEFITQDSASVTIIQSTGMVHSTIERWFESSSDLVCEKSPVQSVAPLWSDRLAAGRGSLKLMPYLKRRGCAVG